MKKLLAIIIALAVIASLAVIPAFADEATRVFTYEGGLTTGPWTGNTDGRKNFHAATFNAASDFVGIGLAQYWNSNGSNQPLVTYDVELFNYSTDYETTVKGTPVFKQTVNPTGDAAEGIYFDMGKTMPKGEYTLRFTVTSAEGYTVLPIGKNLYTNVRIEFSDDPFSFYVDFTDAGLSTYFKKLSTAGEEILENTMYTGSGRDPHNLAEGPIAILVDVPEGYALREVIGIQSPTWGAHESGSDAIAEVYKWTGYAIIVHSLEGLIKKLREYDDQDIYIIGGASVYELMLPYVDTVHVTKIDHKYEADAFFPNLDESPEWEITASSDEQVYFDLTYRFLKYTRVR